MLPPRVGHQAAQEQVNFFLDVFIQRHDMLEAPSLERSAMRQQHDAIAREFSIDRAKISGCDAFFDTVDDEPVAIQRHLHDRRPLLAPERFGFTVSEQGRIRLGADDFAISAYCAAKPLNRIRHAFDCLRDFARIRLQHALCRTRNSTSSLALTYA
jgi:hypothetical protein